MAAVANPVVDEGVSRFGVKRLYRDAGAMATSSAANAVLGAVFWACAAKIFPPEQLGVMTAVLAVIVSAGLVIAAGVGDAYTALLPAVGQARPMLYRRGQRAFWAMAAIAGVGCALATTSLLPGVRGSIGAGVLVAVGVMAWSAFLQQNYTLISLGRARWLPGANVAASLGKIVLLLLLSVTLRWHSVELAFIISAAVIVLAMQRSVFRVIDSGHGLPPAGTTPQHRATSEFNRLVVRTISSATLSLGVINLTPFLVTVFAGPRQGAVFAIALSIVQALDFLIAALAMSLIVHASGSPEHGATMARAILIRAATLATVGGILIVALAPFGLRLLNSEYGEMGATRVIALLAAGYVIRTGFVVWSALQSSRRKLNVPLLLNFIAAAFVLCTVPGLCHWLGASGGALALMLANCVLTAGAAIHFLVTRRPRKHSTAKSIGVRRGESA
jgi:O-antigen/teichoic acid export membrane protein